MSQLTEKYQDVYILAQNLGCTNLIVQEENGDLTLDATCPTRLVADRIWNKVKEVDAELNYGDLMMSLTAESRNIYGKYKVYPNLNRTAMARSITRVRLSYQGSFEENVGLADNPDGIQPSQLLIIPRF
jgi:hypothetical protein